MCVLGLVACTANKQYKPAAFRVISPQASILTVAIEREPTHLFLAEYERYLILSIDGIEKQRIEMFDDTGGYSRTDVFQTSATQYVLRGFDDRYQLDLVRQSVSPAQTFDKKNAKFVGSFDVDDDRVWRFILATERPELPMREVSEIVN